MNANQLRLQYFCICDGQQEILYLKHLSTLLHSESRRVTFAPTMLKQGSIATTLRNSRHIAYIKAALFDHDGNATRFDTALRDCIKGKCIHAFSNLNFDLWLLLHRQDFSSTVSNNKAYIKHVREAFNLGKEADIKNKDVIETSILPQISLSCVKDAVKRASKIREHKLKSDIKKVENVVYYNNPDLSIHDFIKKVFEDSNEPY